MFLAISRTFRGLFSNPRVGAVWALLVGLAGTFYYAQRVDSIYPIKNWLFWQLGAIWGWVILFSVACSTLGQFLLVRVLRLRDLHTLESAVFGMASGVLAFTWGMYVGGALKLYGSVFAVVWPLLMIAVGWREGLAFVRRMSSEYRAPALRSPFAILCTVFGILCLGVLYLGVMTPESLNYDSAWCHMTVAQDYAREHGIVAFPADYTKNVPQLHSLIYTWGFIVPGLTPPLRWMLALHSEFGLFLWTLAGTGAGISALLHDRKVRGAWAAFFLFPIIFVYDSNLGGAADHVCAFFTAPFLIALLRFCRSFRVSDAALLAICSAGALLTKYQAVYLFVPAAVIIVLHGLVYLARGRFAWFGGWKRQAVSRQQVVRGIAVLVGLSVVLASPHFLRNIIFYRNPVYPYLAEVFTGSRPRVANGAYYIEYILKDFSCRPQGTFLPKLEHAVKLWFSFAFEPHYTYSQNSPVFGALFTLLLPLLPFVRHRLRIAIAAAVSGGGLFIWAFTYNVDRNLQIVLPVMVCVAGALLIDGFRLGTAARIGIVPLVLLQVIWGADALFYSGTARIQASLELIRSGYEGHAKTRLDSYRSTYLDIGKALPKNAKVLLHETHANLGIDRPILLDWQGFQGLISYDPLHSPRELFDRFKELGITHLIQIPHEWPAASKQEEVLWNIFVQNYARHVGNNGGYEILSMPDHPPPQEAPYRVAAFGLDGYGDGVYPIERMNANQHLPEQKRIFPANQQPLSLQANDLSETLLEMDAVFVGHRVKLEPRSTGLLNHQFRNLASFGSNFTLYVNRRHLENP